MKIPFRWRRPVAIHAARVALVATVIIGAMYICVVAGFDVVDRHRLVGQIDSRLYQRLANAILQPSSAGSIADYDNAHDTDDAPVFLWKVGADGSVVVLTPGAPHCQTHRGHPSTDRTKSTSEPAASGSNPSVSATPGS